MMISRTASVVFGILLAVSLSASAQIFGLPTTVRTIQNSGRFAYAQVVGTTVSRALNVGVATNPAGGEYVLDVTAAGFTAVPICTGSGFNAVAAGSDILFNHVGPSSTATSQRFLLTVANTGVTIGAGVTWQFICVGP